LLWRQKLVIACTVVAFTILAAVVVFSMTPVYTATATVVLDPTVDPRQRQVTDVDSVTFGLPADSGTVQTEIQVIMSRDLAARVVTRLNFIQDPEFNATLRPVPWYATSKLLELLPTGWASFLQPGTSGVALSPDQETQLQMVRVVNAFLGRLKASAIGESRAIAIAFTSANPHTAAKAANALANLYVAAQLETKLAATQRSNEWLVKQLASLREQLETSQRAVEAYRSESGLLMGKDVTVAAQEITDLGRQLVLAQTRRAETEARLRQAQSVSLDKLENVPEVLNSVLIRTLREQQAGLTAEAAYVSKQKGRNHPDMIGLWSRIRGVQEQIAAEVERIIDGLRNEFTVAVAAEAELERRLIRAKDNLGQANEAQGRLQALQSEATANQTLFDAFLGRLKQTGGDDLLQVPDSHIASHAEVPLTPSFPRKSVLLPLAMAASAFLGLVFAFVNELLDEGVRSMDQVAGQMYVRPLGLIPAQRRSRRKPEDDILVHRNSAFAEALRSLYTSVTLSSIQTPLRTLLITSTLPKEGKTTIAVALARLLAGSGKRVLVVDCDIRRPRAHSIFGSAVTPGLINHLAGEAEVEDVVQCDPKSKVTFITAGRGSMDVSAMFESGRMRQFLAEVATQYDLVILDSAPVLAVSDARVLCGLVDKTIYLVRWAHTRRKAAVNGLRQILEAGGDLAGVALTRVNVKRHAQYGFADSGCYYGSTTRYYSN
jgi:capsular exopolysaccharide synthesis family protein